MDDKLKKNVTAFKKVYVNDKFEFLNPKFCRKCHKKWMNLESKRGDNIEKYIKDMRKEIKWNTDVNVTLKVDEHVDDAGPSGLQTKIEETLINYKDNVTSVSYEHQALPEMKSMEEDSEENDAYKVKANELNSDDFLAEPGPSGVQQKLFVQKDNDKVSNEEKHKQQIKELRKATIRQSSHHKKERNDATTEVKTTMQTPLVLKENVKSTEKELLSYDYWFNLWKEMLCSDGYGPEFRVNYRYCMRKMAEAKKNGWAKHETKDYNYWTQLWKDMFASDKSGELFLEEVNYIVQKRRETKREEESKS